MHQMEIIMKKKIWHILLQSQKIFFSLLLFFLLLDSVVSPTKSRIYIGSLNSQHSLQSFKFAVGWTLGGHTFPDTTVWVNANIHAGKKSEGEFVLFILYSVEIFQMLERCVFYIVDDCQPFHLLLCVGFTKLKISAVGRLQNGHILISYSFCTCASEPLLSVALASGLISVGCKFKLLLLEDSYWVWK